MVKHKVTESESECATRADEPRFRISVCMKRFYSDERALAYVCVSPQRSVRWLQRRLRRLFALPPVRLLSRRHLLPPDEPLALLERDDPVECVPRLPPATLPVPVEGDGAAAAGDGEDSVDQVTMEELERPTSPVSPDDLTETKRQALLMLEQYSAQPAPPRRRRVRRRRRPVAPDEPPACVQPAPGSPQPAPGSREAARGSREPVLGSREPALGSREPVLGSREPAPGSREPAPGSREPAPGSREPVPGSRELDAVAMVLRNELLPRAPRVVRPLCEHMTAAVLVTTSTEVFT